MSPDWGAIWLVLLALLVGGLLVGWIWLVGWRWSLLMAFVWLFGVLVEDHLPKLRPDTIVIIAVIVAAAYWVKKG